MHSQRSPFVSFHKRFLVFLRLALATFLVLVVALVPGRSEAGFPPDNQLVFDDYDYSFQALRVLSLAAAGASDLGEFMTSPRNELIQADIRRIGFELTLIIVQFNISKGPSKLQSFFRIETGVEPRFHPNQTT